MNVLSFLCIGQFRNDTALQATVNKGISFGGVPQRSEEPQTRWFSAAPSKAALSLTLHHTASQNSPCLKSWYSVLWPAWSVFWMASWSQIVDISIIFLCLTVLTYSHWYLPEKNVLKIRFFILMYPSWQKSRTNPLCYNLPLLNLVTNPVTWNSSQWIYYQTANETRKLYIVSQSAIANLHYS